ncbi:TadE/TadG family type IV pilus assembly protein [Xinfangfangia sp. CPCC 101601]|uniref:TadE/TadG family type IV pilus assembly protein n=1 Tax=Pseudogemmobacter lacusdianii TaxID=3069608 RepID=A0ABU0VUX6_9RHOB|nr:TadE/TadG family type IV pilus assembly protein [Xinfangfangia sp. CPCC 101601]MDQ2065353.1 TadE/TadG family type IV pilus assembly protein [Xinfangfangia sp. CPCC 101601]
MISKRFQRFIKSSSGGVTVEFVIIFPLMVLLLILIVFASLLVSTASDVQQFAHELSREALGRFGSGAAITDVCTQMANDSGLMSRLLSQTLLVEPSKLTVLACPSQPSADGFVTVQVSYNFAGSLVQALGQNFGLDMGIISRSSTIRL